MRIDQKLVLSKEFLILTDNVVDKTISVQIDGINKQLKILNSLKIGDKLIMLRVQEGQKYLVLSKVG